MKQSASQPMTVEHYDAAIASLHAKVDEFQTELHAHIDAVHNTGPWVRTDTPQTDTQAQVDANRTEMRAKFTLLYLIWAGIIVVINTVAITGFGILLTRGAGM